MNVPVIDIAAAVSGRSSASDDRRRLAGDIDAACREVGFFAVTGHGVPAEVVDDAQAQAWRFFDLPLADRMSAAKPVPGAPYGYDPIAAEALNRSIGGDTPPDLKETFNIGPIGRPPRPLEEMDDPDERDVHAPNQWPAALPTLRPAIESYYSAMAALAGSIMDLFAAALGLDDGWFESLIDRHGSALRLAHYPALDQAPAAGSMRAGAHTDYGTLTILLLDEEPGLQIEAPTGEWVDVVAPPGALVVNLGDLMERWTNDRWRSTMHRVVVPDGRADRRRLTMPFFHNANWDARVECIVADGERAKYEPVTAGAHLMSKFRSTVV